MYLLVGWIALTLIAYLAVLPLLIMAKRGDRALAGQPRGLAHADGAGVPSPQRLGYAGVVLQRLTEHARTVLGVHRAWIAIGTPADGFVGVAAAGLDTDLIGSRFTAQFDGLELAASAPVTVGGEVRGTFCVASTTDSRNFAPLDFELLAELASLTGEVLAHHDRHELSRGDSAAEIDALVKALAQADGGVYQHSLDVAATARAVGERVGLDGADLVEVELGALLHDVGKLRLPASVLEKAGSLDDDERRLVRLHPEWGSDMVASVPGLAAVALIVRLHHERPDGTGYPHGLEVERLPIASRIVSACDAYGAMTRGRNYREPLEVDAALEELEFYAGSQFDPLVVDVLARFVREPVAAAA